MRTDRSRIAIAARRFSRATVACSSLAIAVALTSAPARAQSFLGSSTTTFGNAVVTTGTNTTTITVNSPSAVIDWTPTDTATSPLGITWQPVGTTATYTGASNYTVLNRIIPVDPTRLIAFDGIVNSLVGGSPGGTVFFYSPGGIVASINSRFNVGNLGLTSSAPVVDAAGNWFVGNQVQFQASAAGRAVNTLAGAQINAPAEGSFVALVAPVISQRGAINVNGQAALVSADAATITFSPSGLFDIQVTSGTSGNLGGFNSTLFNDGTITGPVSSGAGDNHRVYMVAVPKNTAIFLGIAQGSQLGFNIAGAADVVGNAVVLSAGRDIVAGNIAGPRSAGGGTGASDLNIANTAVTSSLRGSSTDETFFFSIGGGTASTASTVNLQADTRATYTADGAGSVTTGNGAVTLTSDRSGNGVTGGQTDIFAINNGQLNITSGGAVLQSRGFGANGAAPGSVGLNATGGLALITATTGGDVTITGPVTVSATGQGGLGNAAAGGNGTGGRAQIFAQDAGSSITINGTATVNANGIGGVGNGGGAGGIGTGGQAFINAQVAASSGIAITGASAIQAIGLGGNANGRPGGTGIGGTAVAAASVNNSVQFGSTLAVSGLGIGGNATGGNAGSAAGGTARIVLFSNGTMSIGGDTQVLSNGFTGSGNPNTALAQGGTTNVEAQNNSVLTIAGGLLAASGGIGSGTGSPTIGTGSGRGGSTNLLVATGGSVSTTTGIAVRSLGIGADGGSGTGGTVLVQLNGGTVSGGTLEVNASGTGGSIGAAASGNGGVGTGGTASIQAFAGVNTLTFTSIDVLASGGGGNVSGTSGNGGAAVGGIAQINSFGGASLTVNAADTTIDGSAAGGTSISVTGNGGAGNAGRGVLTVDNGSAIFNGNVSISGESEGGSGITGGAAFGDPENNVSRAFVLARNGALTVTGSTDLRATASGGNGSFTGNGGNATAGFANLQAINAVNTTGPGIISLGDVSIDSSAFSGSAVGTGNGGTAAAGRAHMIVNGGTINVSGDANLSGDAFAGSGVNGGNAISVRPFRQPRALIASFNGSVTVGGSTQLSAGAFGGDGAPGFGGTGGIAFAGAAAVDAQSTNGPSTTTLSDLTISAAAFGGDGGSATPTGIGGAGGDAYGGSTSAFGNAGQGTLNVTGDTTIDATAFGGIGGTGHPGATGTDGGVGGRAFGGGITVGMVSGFDTPSNTGSSTFGLVTGDASAFGGLGGAGGSGTTQGNGGAGGTGFGGFAGILVRGSPATFDTISFDASGIGGNGGLGTLLGDGGDGFAGDTALTVTQRFNRTERGTLTANTITLTAGGVGGSGASNGDSFYSASEGPESDFFVRQGDATIGNFSLNYSGTLAPNITGNILQVVDDFGIPIVAPFTVTSEPFDINLMQGNAAVTGALNITTAGNIRVSLDTSTLNVGDLTLTAKNFVLPTVRPTTLGTITVSGNLNIASALDFLAYANVNTQNTNFFDVDGSVLIGDYTSTGGLSIAALGNITTGNVTVNGDNEFFAGGAIATGSITASEGIDLDAGGSITTAALTAGDTVTAQAGGPLIVGNVSAGLVNPSTSTGVTYTIGLRSLASVTAGTLSARNSVGLSSPGTISVGNISSGLHVLGLAGTGFTSGSITTPATSTGNTPQVYIANFSMETLGGVVGGNFNPVAVFQAPTQVAINGSVAINGPVTTGSLRASGTGMVSVGGPISASASTGLTGVQGVTVGTNGTGGFAPAAITSGILVALTSTAGAVSAGTLAAGDQVTVMGQTGVTLGNVSAGIVNPSTNPSFQTNKIAIGAGAGAVSTGTLTARNDIGVQAAQSIATGNIASTTGRSVLLLPGTSLTTGSISATPGTQQTGSTGGRVYIGNFSQATPTANVFSTFQNLALFNVNPVRTSGPITIGGAVTAGSFKAATAQAFTASGITVQSGSTSLFGELFVDSGQTIVVNAAWRAPSIRLMSNDIDITSTGTLNGFVELISTNQTIAVIGDISSSGNTQPGSGGYRLTDAEFDRISGGFSFGARDNTGDVDLLVGDLSVDATKFSSDTEGGEIFVYSASTSGSTGSSSDLFGRIRIDGNVAVTGATTSTSGDESFGVGFRAKSFEINAATGSVTVAGANGVLAGGIRIEADNIHVATDTILLKLRTDPFYEGSVQELNAASPVQRPDGVLRANILQLAGNKTIYIQNTGSAVVPAGFVTRLDDFGDEGTSIGPNDSSSSTSTDKFKIVINGQVQTATGAVTGKAAFDLIVAAARADLDPGEVFAADLDPASTLNGCNIISSVCAFGNSDPVSSISSEIKLAIINQLADAPVPDVIEEAADSSTESADEEASQSAEEEDEAEADEAASPIAPPAPLINTRPLNPAVNVIEPVAGAGNPALIGSAVNEATAQGDTP